ncbi:MAG: hypothetical protein ACRD20_02330 [Terriglobales bacterium]
MTPEQIAALIIQLGPVALQMFLALEARLNLSSDEKTNIANAIAAANSADADTLARVAAWMQANGFKPVFLPIGPARPIAPQN